MDLFWGVNLYIVIHTEKKKNVGPTKSGCWINVLQMLAFFVIITVWPVILTSLLWLERQKNNCNFYKDEMLKVIVVITFIMLVSHLICWAYIFKCCFNIKELMFKLHFFGLLKLQSTFCCVNIQLLGLHFKVLFWRCWNHVKITYFWTVKITVHILLR